MSKENNKLLEELYYDPKFGLLSSDKFIIKVHKQYPNIKRSDIKEFVKNQEINQIASKKTSNIYYKITGPDLTFQIDLCFINKSIKSNNNKKGSLYIFLLAIDILSRKAFIYPLEDKTKESIMKGYKLFLEDVKTDVNKTNEYNYTDDKPYCIISDNEFSFNKNPYKY